MRRCSSVGLGGQAAEGGASAGGESLTDTGGFAAGLRVETWDFSPTEHEGSTGVNRSGVEAKRRREGTAARAALKRAD